MVGRGKGWVRVGGLRVRVVDRGLGWSLGWWWLGWGLGWG